jgi:hypothetical protein
MAKGSRGPYYTNDYTNAARLAIATE